MREIKLQLVLGDKIIEIDRIEWRKGKPYRAGYYDKEFDKTHWFYLDTKLGYALRESTGLKDKNGVEVYEGDIVLCSRKARCPHEVVWQPAAMFQSMGEWNLSDMRDSYDWIGDEEVIGNVYENPEFLTPSNQQVGKQEGDNE